MPIQYHTGVYGTTAVVAGEFKEEMLGYFKKNNVIELELNTSKGWVPKDLDFLVNCQNLLSLILVGLTLPLKNVSDNLM